MLAPIIAGTAIEHSVCARVRLLSAGGRGEGAEEGKAVLAAVLAVPELRSMPIHTPICLCTRLYACLHTCLYIYLYTCPHTFGHVHILVHRPVCRHVCRHVHRYVLQT